MKLRCLVLLELLYGKYSQDHSKQVELWFFSESSIIQLTGSNSVDHASETPPQKIQKSHDHSDLLCHICDILNIWMFYKQTKSVLVDWLILVVYSLMAYFINLCSCILQDSYEVIKLPSHDLWTLAWKPSNVLAWHRSKQRYRSRYPLFSDGFANYCCLSTEFKAMILYRAMAKQTA